MRINPIQHVPGSATSPSTYTWRPPTEQFFGGNDQARFPINNVVSCSSDGLVLCLGTGELLTTDSAFSSAAIRELNRLGLGPVSQAAHDAREFATDEYGVNRNTRQIRTSATRIAGQNGELADKKFVSVDVDVAIDSTGSMWLWGGFSANLLGLVSDLPLVNNRLLWPTEKQIFSYETPSGAVTSSTKLGLRSVVRTDANDITFTNTICVLTDDGKLLVWKGGFPQISGTTPDRFFLMTGFVDSISISNGGSGYTSAPIVTASAPSSSYGTRATFEAAVSGGSVTALRLLEPGWGYTSPPTISFSGGGGTGAAASCSIFEGSFSFIGGSVGARGACLAIDSAGKAYTLCGGIHPNQQGTALIKSRYPYLIPGQDAAGYSKGYLSNFSSMAVLLTTDGHIDTFGIGPDGTSSTSVERYDSEQNFVDVAIAGNADAAVLALTEGGDLYSYGHAQGGLCGRGYTADAYSSISQIEGDAKWLAVFGGGPIFVANRSESFDEIGNRIDPIEPGLA